MKYSFGSTRPFQQAERKGGDDDVYSARGHPAQKALLLIYYVQFYRFLMNAYKPIQYYLQT
jgi:hypothetical protein